MSLDIIVLYDQKETRHYDEFDRDSYKRKSLSTTYHGYVTVIKPEHISYSTEAVALDTYLKRKLGSTLYLATIIYSDGDTFGSTSGYRYIVGVYGTSDEAEQAISTARNSPSNQGYKPWVGFFSRYDGSEVEALRCLD